MGFAFDVRPVPASRRILFLSSVQQSAPEVEIIPQIDRNIVILRFAESPTCEKEQIGCLEITVRAALFDYAVAIILHPCRE